MSEQRNIVLILGNGFDLDYGLKTSYMDFWESDYCPKYYPAPLIHYLNQSWPNNLESIRWYDLENALLDYYKQLKDQLHGDDFITDEEKEFLKTREWSYNEKSKLIIQSLKKKRVVNDSNTYRQLDCPFLNDIFQTPVWRDRKALGLIKNGLCEFLLSQNSHVQKKNSLANDLLLTMSKSVEAGDSVSIFSFNYTPVPLKSANLEEIPVYYMHGSCSSSNIIIGTRDDLSFSSSYDFLEKAMDDNYLPPGIVTALKEADEVIIFGHSLGENDSQYFTSFFSNQANVDNSLKKEIILFTRDTDSKRDLKRAFNKLTNGKLSELYNNHPIIIRCEEIEKDQPFLFEFLIKHHFDEDSAQAIIGNYVSSSISPKESEITETLADYIRFDPSNYYQVRENPLPDQSGSYFVGIRGIYALPAHNYHLQSHRHNDVNIIYVGNAKISLKESIVSHLFGHNSIHSKFRQSLGSLFMFKKQLGAPSIMEKEKEYFSPEDEEWITSWMVNNLVIYYYPNDDPEGNGFRLIQLLNPPLNLNCNHNKVNSDFRSALCDLINQRP